MGMYQYWDGAVVLVYGVSCFWDSRAGVYQGQVMNQDPEIGDEWVALRCSALWVDAGDHLQSGCHGGHPRKRSLQF